MQQAGVKTFVFSSSATVYGDPQKLPLTEDHPRSATNPYGHTKLVVEDILENLYRSEGGWRIARLRYFKPVGAHLSGLLGEATQGVHNSSAEERRARKEGVSQGRSRWSPDP